MSSLPTAPRRQTPWTYLLSYEAGLDLPADELLTLARTDPQAVSATAERITTLQRTVEKQSRFIGDDLHSRRPKDNA